MKRKILVVDDDHTIRMLMVRILTRVGYEVSTATNGHDAVIQFEADEPDLIITDLTMPCMDGYELCRKIREISSVLILVVTAWASLEEKCKAFETGANAFMRKPFELQELRALVEALLRGDLRHPGF